MTSTSISALNNNSNNLQKKMSFKIACLLLLACVAAIHAAEAPKEADQGRIFLSTFTVILSTVTSTTTVGSTTTCTTSTSALNTCSVGRRRRGLFYDDAENSGRARRGLFYNDDEAEVSAPVKRSAEVAAPAPQVTTDENKSVPLVVQSGFSLPEGFVTPSGTPRFKLAYGTSTVTTTSTSIATRSLTATCASTTSFSLCSSAGK
ncbi:uncharacterized protein LOC124329488 [Daphnia pulicaria]|uniref:uncharacterized protein LOC124329488 n=1 Tax=Daphnia pulicaria TaxID=35523 RepID=UPI001EEBAD52|nr:uncharacterized protein LOC124329488 [Daphnia pulicaria]